VVSFIRRKMFALAARLQIDLGVVFRVLRHVGPVLTLIAAVLAVLWAVLWAVVESLTLAGPFRG
jgi:hypothetical protein